VNALGAAQERLIARFEVALEVEVQGWASWPKALVEPCRYVLFGGGKRVRPFLALAAVEAVGGSVEDGLPWAIAVEMVHTYSLVHDDLPSMDDDDLRRGRPTCHRAFDEAHAILAGDALFTRAFGVLSEAHWSAETTVSLTRMLAHAAGGAGMVGGQVLDISGQLNTVTDVQEMQRLKTGALIGAAAEGGAVAAGAPTDTVAALARYGAALGMLFQLTDDLLDREQDAETGGNNLLHHLTLDAVLHERETVAAKARQALGGLANQRSLLALVDAIAEREV
jgi:geranylgeranyl pyrophosphate synthase